jgi:hypothetical protein
MAKLKVQHSRPRLRSFASFEWQHFSSRTTLTGTTVGAASVANLTANMPLDTR